MTETHINNIKTHFIAIKQNIYGMLGECIDYIKLIIHQRWPNVNSRHIESLFLISYLILLLATSIYYIRLDSSKYTDLIDSRKDIIACTDGLTAYIEHVEAK